MIGLDVIESGMAGYALVGLRMIGLGMTKLRMAAGNKVTISLVRMGG